MEYRDRMIKYKRRRTLVFGAVWLLFLSVFLLKQYRMPGLFGGFTVVFDVLFLLYSVEVPLVILFERMRPEFQLTGTGIIFSNRPPPYLLFKKGMLYSVTYRQMADMAAYSDAMVFRIKDHPKPIKLLREQLDDFDAARKSIIDELEKNGIPIRDNGRIAYVWGLG